MRHRNKKKILSRKHAPREALMRGLCTSLILYEKIRTTKAKAKVLRSRVEKLITLGKEKNLTSRRRLLSELYVKNAADKVLDVFGPKYKERKGGYTRIIPIGSRKGDGAEMVIIEFV